MMSSLEQTPTKPQALQLQRIFANRQQQKLRAENVTKMLKMIALCEKKQISSASSHDVIVHHALLPGEIFYDLGAALDCPCGCL